jgi:VTC domain
MPETPEGAIERLDGVSLDELDERASLRRRVDRKYLLPAAAFVRTLADLSKRYEVLEIDSHRSFRYESVYFDAPDLRCFREHVEGEAPRFKARSRLYRETRACFFEVKMKTAEGRTLKRQLDIDAEEHGALTDEQREFVTSALESCAIDPPERLGPSLTTRFRRITVIAADAPQRVTADLDVEMVAPDGRTARVRDDRVLVETKSEDGEGAFDDALAGAGFASISLSKYRTGIALLETPDPDNPLGADLERVFEGPDSSRGEDPTERALD